MQQSQFLYKIWIIHTNCIVILNNNETGDKYGTDSSASARTMHDNTTWRQNTEYCLNLIEYVFVWTKASDERR